MRHLIQVLLMALAASLPAHGIPAERSPSVDIGPILIDPPSYDMERILFSSGKPEEGESLMAALADSKAGMSALEAAVHYLGDVDELRVVVVGYADKSECTFNDCDALAQRRAALVYDWLKSHGVAAHQLVRHQGNGISEPVDFSDTEAQRQNNRRVEFHPYRMNALDQEK